jgi:hypothetical protein
MPGMPLPNIGSLKTGMVFAAPLMAEGQVVVPRGTSVTEQLLVLLHDLDRVRPLGGVNVEAR